MPAGHSLNYYILHLKFHIQDYDGSRVCDSDVAKEMLELTKSGKCAFPFARMKLCDENEFLSVWCYRHKQTGMHLEPKDYTAWAEIDRGMTTLSQVFPTITFVIEAIAVEYENDMRKRIYRNGRRYESDAN